MEFLVSSLNVVMPLFFMILAGVLLKKLGLLPDSLNDGISKLVVRVFLPAMLLVSTYKSDIRDGIDMNFVLFSVGALTVTFVLLMLIVPRLVPDRSKRSVMILSCFRSNTAIYGIPVVTGIYGDEAAGEIMLLLSMMILISNFYSIIAIESMSGKKVRPLKVVISCLSKPIMIGLILGLVLQFLPFRLPAMILSPLTSIGNLTTPLAFISLGATFTISSSRRNAKHIAWATLVKLVIYPGVWIGLGLLLGFSGYNLCALICAFATPTAVSSYALVKGAGDDAELMGENVVFTTALSLITIFLLVFSFMSAGLFY